MTEAEIDARCDAIMADVRKECQTLRRSLGQRFRWIQAEQRARFIGIKRELWLVHGRRQRS